MKKIQQQKVLDEIRSTAVPKKKYKPEIFFAKPKK